MPDLPDIMRPEQVRDFTKNVFEHARSMRLLSPGGQVKTVYAIGKRVVVIFEDGTKAVLTVTVRRAQDSSEGESGND